jgi:hypothetical protein
VVARARSRLPRDHAGPNGSVGAHRRDPFDH